MERRLASLALLALLAAGSAAARADDRATVRSKVSAAMRAAKSYMVTTTASTGFSVTTTFAAPDRYHSTLTYSGQVRDVVLIGPVAYISDGRAAGGRRGADPAARNPGRFGPAGQNGIRENLGPVHHDLGRAAEGSALDVHLR